MTVMIRRLLSFAAVLALSFSMMAGQLTNKTDVEIKELIIKDSIASYRGSCPCPSSKDSAGKNCGARIAYSKPGGASPICYGKDVTQKMVDDYRSKHGS